MHLSQKYCKIIFHIMQNQPMLGLFQYAMITLIFTDFSIGSGS